MLYTADILACLGLAGMLWAHSQGWRPNPRHLLLVSSGRRRGHGLPHPGRLVGHRELRRLRPDRGAGREPVHAPTPLAWLGDHSPYTQAVGTMWKTQPSVYGPFATVIQCVRGVDRRRRTSPPPSGSLMILNGAVFIGVGVLLLKTSDDPVRATLFWTANPVLIQQLVSGGHLDTFVAAAAICAIQVARRVPGCLGRRRWSAC